MRDTLDRVLQPVRPVVHRVDAPPVALAMVLLMQDAVHHRVAHIQVAGGHVNFRPQRAAAVRKLPRAHPREEVKVLCDGAVAIGAGRARLSDGAARPRHLFGGEIAHVGLALLDQLNSPLVHLLKVIRGVEDAVFEIGADPAHVLDDGIHVFLLFLRRVGVVEAQVELPVEVKRDTVVNPQRFGVADVQVGVRLRREARVHAVKTPRAQVVLHRLADEVGADILTRISMWCLHHSLRRHGCPLRSRDTGCRHRHCATRRGWGQGNASAKSIGCPQRW
ncbi:MAG: hypothetical protein BWY76_00057 [bacterium ADurb.Bin429]|nr:MAG: hypothetical protein BWY76_00057 [bacterium ADurb.Bin429]